MPVLKESPEWVENIYGVDVGDPVSGGESGVVNQPLRDLAKRTLYLKSLLSRVSTELASINDLVGGIDVSDALMKEENLADLPNKAVARTNLGVSAEDHKHDADYLRIAQSLADVPDPSAALQAIGAAAKEHSHGYYQNWIVGQIFMFAGITTPPNCLDCNGGLVSRATEAELFKVIGTLYGAGDGSTTFRLPDFRGVVPRGWDNGRGLDSGRSFGSYQNDALQNVTGKFIADAPNGVNATGPFSATRRGVGPGSSWGETSSYDIAFNLSNSARIANETRMKNIAVRFIIVARSK